MKRPQLFLVAAVVLVGIWIAVAGGPSLNDRIRSSDTCGELLAVLPDVRDTGAQSVLRTYQDRARALGCGG